MSLADKYKGFKTPEWRKNLAIEKPAARTVFVIIMLATVLGIGILAAFIAARSGVDYQEGEECDCPTEVEKGWKWFSIALISLGIPLLVVFFIFFGCKIQK